MNSRLFTLLSEHAALVTILAVFLPFVIFSPTMIAVVRRLPDRRKIALLNLAGAVFVGPWVAALLWALLGRADESAYAKILQHGKWIFGAMAVGLVLLVCLAFYLYNLDALWGRSSGSEHRYRYVMLTQRPGSDPVLASGRLVPRKLVRVSSEVSGKIIEIYVKANDRVVADQPIAQIDPSTYRARFEQARADVARAAAGVSAARSRRAASASRLTYLRQQLRRIESLHERGFVTRSQFDLAKSDHDAAQSSVAEADSDIAALEAEHARARATRNAARLDLARTVIRSPINGTVLARQVEPGQTVVSSFQAPTLFEIAEALSSMQIESAVDETEIGRIAQGQAVRFTVDAYPDRLLTGVVQEIHKAPVEEDGLVRYKVVVSVPYHGDALFSGMTAAVTFLAGAERSRWAVPMASLRFAPDGTPRPSGEHGVYRLVDGALQFVPVTLGARVADRGVIQSDQLRAGDRIVIGVRN